MGCDQVSTTQVRHEWNYPSGFWHGDPNDWFEDETINDTSLGCDWWGEEFVGAVFLND
jgi:hypothetical protein